MRGIGGKRRCMNILENTASYINVNIGQPLTDIEVDMLINWQRQKFYYYSPDVWRGLISKGYMEIRGLNELWLTQKGESYK